MNLLPRANSVTLRWTLLVLAAASAWVVGQGVWAVVSGQFAGFVSIGIFSFTGVGLWLRLNAARILALAVLWFVAIFLPVGVINPFAAMDSYDPLPVWHLALLVYPWVIASLFAIHVLGKYKKEFRRWPKAAV